MGRVPILVDGGIRRGTDVIKALALGGQAVLIGRPYVYALGVGGLEGVKKGIQILRTELEMAMALCGDFRLDQIDRRVLLALSPLRTNRPYLRFPPPATWPLFAILLLTHYVGGIP